jgi:serine/threonine protein kinase
MVLLLLCNDGWVFYTFCDVRVVQPEAERGIMGNLTLGTLGPYRLLSLLGAGGMAEVYRAHDPRLDREVAIKVLPVDLARQPGFLERFRREARNVARLDHPNILPIYDFGEQDGATYVVMPLVEGGTLRDRIVRQGVCSLREAASILYQLAQALQEAHARGLVHRDVKPANVLLGPGERVLLADFGIACALADESEPALTQMGMGIGTAEYMSPEQARGEPVDHRADVYALGIVFFQMLTGRVPFTSDDHFSTALMQVHEEPPAPRSLNPTIPPAVEALMLKALEKDPARRFQSAAEFAQGLSQALHTLGLPGATGPTAGPHMTAPRTSSGRVGEKRADAAPLRGRQSADGAGVPSWSAWPSTMESNSLTVPFMAGHQRATGLIDMEDSAFGGGARPIRHGRWRVLVGVLLALLLVGGAFAAVSRLHLQPNMAAAPPTSANAALPPASPTATATATPLPQNVYYMANFFALQQDDMQPGDHLGALMAISNDQYQANEGENGTIYRSGAATRFGRAFGTGTVVRNDQGAFRFVVLVDRFNSPAQAQQYYQYELSLLSQTTVVPAGQQAMAGLARVMDGQAVYRLVMLDSNIVVTFASNETGKPLAFQATFAQLAQIIDQRGHRCQYTPQLKPVAGSPAMCK